MTQNKAEILEDLIWDDVEHYLDGKVENLAAKIALWGRLNEGLGRIDQEWISLLPKLFDRQKLDKVVDLYARSLAEGKRLCPNIYWLFCWLEGVSPDPEQVRLIVIGQDPYPQCQGVGYAFAYTPVTKMPLSFKRIVPVLAKLAGLRPVVDLAFDNMLWWARRSGIISLNAALTVEIGNPGSHQKLWREPVRYVLRTMRKLFPEVQVVTFGKAAEQVTEGIVEPLYRLPHPASRTWNTKQVLDSIEPVLGDPLEDMDGWDWLASIGRI